jgi:chromosomal replication initiator protein
MLTPHAPKKKIDCTEANDNGSQLLVSWSRVATRLRAELGEEVFSSWFARVEPEEFDGATLILSVPTRFLKSWISGHYGEKLLSAWQQELPKVMRVDLRLRQPTPLKRDVQDAPSQNPPQISQLSSAASFTHEAPAAQSSELTQGLDARLTFDCFVVGRNNRVAQAAARQVAEAQAGDPLLFNPFYVHANVGRGKTHLLQAIAWQALQSRRKVMYLTAEDFTFRFVSALKSKDSLSFKEKLRDIDILLIDDLQFLRGTMTQQEFCHTLNTLIDAGKQIVVAADRAPVDLETLEERVRSRLSGGLVVEIGALEKDVRIDILNTKLKSAQLRHANLEMPEEVLEFVAENVTGNGRDLEGAFNRILAHNQLAQEPITLEFAETVIRDLVRAHEPRKVKIDDIQKVVARFYKVSRADLLSSRRAQTVVRPRQVAMYLSKALTPRSLPEIGRRFGGRDHTTVLHAVRKIESLMAKDQTLVNDVDCLRRELEG